MLGCAFAGFCHEVGFANVHPKSVQSLLSHLAGSQLVEMGSGDRIMTSMCIPCSSSELLWTLNRISCVWSGCGHLLTVTSASALPQVVPDPDPSAEGEYWDGAAGAASGCEECWHPGKAAQPCCAGACGAE